MKRTLNGLKKRMSRIGGTRTNTADISSLDITFEKPSAFVGSCGAYVPTGLPTHDRQDKHLEAGTTVFNDAVDEVTSRVENFETTRIGSGMEDLTMYVGRADLGFGFSPVASVYSDEVYPEEQAPEDVRPTTSTLGDMVAFLRRKTTMSTLRSRYSDARSSLYSSLRHQGRLPHKFLKGSGKTHDSHYNVSEVNRPRTCSISSSNYCNSGAPSSLSDSRPREGFLCLSEQAAEEGDASVPSTSDTARLSRFSTVSTLVTSSPSSIMHVPSTIGDSSDNISVPSTHEYSTLSINDFPEGGPFRREYDPKSRLSDFEQFISFIERIKERERDFKRRFTSSEPIPPWKNQ